MSETVSERPTMEAAFAADVAPAADPLPATPTPEDGSAEQASPAATVPPVEQPTGEVPEGSGPIPLDRHKAILDGAYKERDALKQQLETIKQQTGWLESPEGQQLRQWSHAFQTNPRAWFAQTAQELVQAYPDLAGSLRSDAARILAGGRTAQPEVDLEPDIPVVDDKGQVVNHAYSAARVKQFVTHAVAEALAKEVGPLKQTVQSVEQERRLAADTAKAHDVAKAEYAKAQAWPGFTEHVKDIAAAYEQHPEWSLQDAYIAVAVPKLRQSGQAQTLTDLKTKAAASTVNPATAAVTTTQRPKSLTDPSLVW